MISAWNVTIPPGTSRFPPWNVKIPAWNVKDFRLERQGFPPGTLRDLLQGMAPSHARPRQGWAGQRRARQGKAGQAKPCPALPCPPSGRAGQGRAGHARPGQARPDQGRAGQGKARQGRARQGKARQALPCYAPPIIKACPPARALVRLSVCAYTRGLPVRPKGVNTVRIEAVG
jgi:hypothetical protein